MGYFDDFQLLNVINIRMYGAPETSPIFTTCNYIGLIRGMIVLHDQVETRPLVYLTPRNLHTFSGCWSSPAGKYRDNFYIECNGERSDRIMAAFDAVSQPRIIFIRDAVPFLTKFNELQKLFSAGEFLNRRRIALCMEEFTALLEEELHAEKNPAADRCDLYTLLLEISRDPGKKRDFAAYAKKSGFTLRHWNRIFTAATGMPPHRFVNSCRLKAARNLLCSTNLSIKEIAEKCGFESASDFSRFFKKNTAVTPGKCRRSALH